MRNIWRNNGLSIVLFSLFLIFLFAQSLTGHRLEREELLDHSAPPVTYWGYLTSGGFVEATFENWESEFLQMFAYVIFTVFLYQRGSSESKKLEMREKVDADPRRVQDKRNAPWPVRRGGSALRLYENSLSLAFLLLFFLSFVLHAAGGAADYNQERELHEDSPITTLQYIGTARFWFESFQNWQSEFLAVAAIVLLSVFLRQRGSPESKPVAAPYHQTGQ
ncbi:MAG TPA: DUF6766 family protein [Gemmatimonadota bacterium]|nr:DUF6766 family protein [Gemmatimonadota bacterium]